MGMKLLPKHELDQQKATEQRRIVEEGIKIAKKVDSLREVRIEEEVALEKWRYQTIETIGKQIADAIERRDRATQEAAEAEQRRETALKPLDDERTAIVAERAVVERQGKEVSGREELVKDREFAAEALLERANFTNRDSELRDSVSRAWYQEAYERSEASKRVLAETSDLRAGAERYRRDVELELTHRVKTVVNRESRATVIETEQNARETALNTRETLLKDREEMVERDFKRTKK